MGTWQHLFVKLGLSEDEYADLLFDLYYNHKLSHAKIADKFGTHVETIRRNCKKYNIQSRTISEATRIAECKEANLTKNQENALIGILLGDGHLDGQSTISARITYGCKFRETLQDIILEFQQLHFSTPWESKIGNWHFKSSFYTDLRSHWCRWYPNGKKIVPKNIKLSKLSCYWWFVGDGYQVDYGLQFCTDDFDVDSLLVLCKELTRLGFDSQITPSTSRIRIKGKSAPAMLKWLRPLVVPQYAYKWRQHRKQSESF